MLPDYPKVKALLSKALIRQIDLSRRCHLGPFNEMRTSIIHEGESGQILREDGSIGEITPKRVLSEVFLPGSLSDFEETSPADILEMMKEIGRKLAVEQEKIIIDTVEEACKAAGTITSLQSDPIEGLLESVGKRFIEFDEAGQPIFGVCVANPETMPKVQDLWNRIFATPELKSRFDNLIEQKRRQFLDREASRKLVE